MTTTYQSQQTSEFSSPTYYVSDYSKFSLWELWQMTNLNPFRLVNVAKFLFAKTTGRPLRTGVPSLNENRKRIELGEIPDAIMRDLDSPIRSLQLAGFAPRLVQTSTRSKGNFGYAVHLVSADRLSVAGVIFARVFVLKNTKTEVAIGIYTHRQNGQVVVTTNSPARLKSPPYMRVNRLVGATADQLVARHRKRILNCTDLMIVNESNLTEHLRAQARRLQDFHVARGLYVPANPVEMMRHRDRIIAPGYFESPD